MQRPSLKSRILDHAETRLLEQGYRGMRVDELARDAGISKRTLYEQFRTKEEMAQEALARRFKRLESAIEQAIAEHGTESDQLRTIVLLISRVYANAQPSFYQDLETTPALTRLARVSREHTHAKIDQIIEAGMARGHFWSRLDGPMARRVLLAAVDDVARNAKGREVEQEFEAILDVVLNGLLARRA